MGGGSGRGPCVRRNTCLAAIRQLGGRCPRIQKDSVSEHGPSSHPSLGLTSPHLHSVGGAWVAHELVLCGMHRRAAVGRSLQSLPVEDAELGPSC